MQQETPHVDSASAAALAHVTRGFTWRTVVVSLVLIPANVYWVEQMEMMRYSAHPTTISLFFNAVFSLLVLALANQLLRRFAPRLALSQAEMLLVYSMICIASSVCGHDGIQVLMPYFSWSFRMATPENKWDDLFNPDLPKWLTVQDPRVLKGFYEGGESFYRHQIISAWIGPVALWSLFIFALMMVLFGITVLIRKQWLEGEHLACPLVNLPVEIANPAPRLFREKLFWIGFILAASMDTYNSFAFLYPALPKIPLDHVDMSTAFKGRPWNAVGWTPRSFYPFMVGLGYLMPSDFLFSCWFFYIFWKLELVLSASLGWNQIPQFPFNNFQAFGAYALFGIQAIILARGYLQQVWHQILRSVHGAQANEAISYRLAAACIAVGFVVLVWFGAAIGLRVWVAVLFFLIYFGLAVAITRMRAQFGTPVHDLHFTGPDEILTAVIGPRNLPKKDLITFSLFYWFNRAYRNHPMPHQMEAMRMQELSGGRNRGVAQAIMLATFVALVSGFWAFLHMYYDLGARAKGRMFSGESFTKLQSWLLAPQGTNWYALGAIGVGFAFGLLLQTMRLRYAWWPFHPLGYAISGSWEMNLVWMPLLIAWLIKSAIIKWLGDRYYQKAVPIFMGLILGQFVVGSILNIVSIALHIPSYMFWQ
jgi:hypothetical protein